MSHRRIDSQTFGVIRIIIARKSAVYRLLQQSDKAMLGVLACSVVISESIARRPRADAAISSLNNQ
jgi:hypothetical protein